MVLLEAITGRDPIDYDRPPDEVILVDFFSVLFSTKLLHKSMQLQSLMKQSRSYELMI